MPEPIKIHLTIDAERWIKMLYSLNQSITELRTVCPSNDTDLRRMCDLRDLLILTSTA